MNDSRVVEEFRNEIESAFALSASQLKVGDLIVLPEGGGLKDLFGIVLNVNCEYAQYEAIVFYSREKHTEERILITKHLYLRSNTWRKLL